jgi:hypothetical protein
MSHYRAFIVPHIHEIFTIKSETLDLQNSLAVLVTVFEILSLVTSSWMNGVFLPLPFVS